MDNETFEEMLGFDPVFDSLPVGWYVPVTIIIYSKCQEGKRLF